jgi:transposase
MLTTLESNNATQGRISMSTSLLYHGFGIRGYRYVRTDFLEGEVMFTIEQERDNLRCSA